jgi:hypothetical protein
VATAPQVSTLKQPDEVRGLCPVILIYRLDKSQIEARIAATCDEIIEQTRRNAHEFVWGNDIPTVEQLGQVRLAAMRTFLADYDIGRGAGRYVEAELPMLPFADSVFDLALCSHLLFLYSMQLGEGFHRAAVRELCRVASEVRIFPLLALGGSRSPFVDLCALDARNAGDHVSIEHVPYEFQRGGNQMMRIRVG